MVMSGDLFHARMAAGEKKLVSDLLAKTQHQGDGRQDDQRPGHHPVMAWCARRVHECAWMQCLPLLCHQHCFRKQDDKYQPKCVIGG